MTSFTLHNNSVVGTMFSNQQKVFSKDLSCFLGHQYCRSILTREKCISEKRFLRFSVVLLLISSDDVVQ